MVKRILITIAGVWLFIVIGGAIMGNLVAPGGAIHQTNLLFADATCTVSATADTYALNQNAALASATTTNFNVRFPTANFQVPNNQAPTIKYTISGADNGLYLGAIIPATAAWWAYPSQPLRIVAITASQGTPPTNALCNSQALNPVTFAAGAGNVSVGSSTPTAMSQTSYSGIAQSIYGFVPLVILIAFVAPVFALIGIAGFTIRNRFSTRDEY